jgi:DNA polymerase III subunit beta
VKLTIDRKVMLDALAVVAGVVPTRSPKPVLQNVKLVADADGAAVLMATDLEIGIRRTVPGVTVDAPGAVLLPPARFQAILRTSGDDMLTLAVEGDTITIRGARAKFELPSEDADLFPDVPDAGDQPTVSLSGASLRRLIRRTAFATDVESTRYALGGVLVEFNGTTLVGIGTDGRRLARQTVDAVGGGEATIPPGAVMPLKALKLIERAIDDGDAAGLVVTDKAAAVYADGTVIHTRLVEGRFPRYQDVFPAEPAATATIDAGTLLGGVEQAGITTSEESRGVDFAFGPDALTLAAHAADVGKSDVSIPLALTGEPVEITFDGRYLVEALRTLTPDTPVKVELIDHKNAAVFRTDDGFAYVVMPLTREGR